MSLKSVPLCEHGTVARSHIHNLNIWRKKSGLW